MGAVYAARGSTVRGRLRDLQLLQQRCYEDRGLAQETSEGTVVLCHKF